MTHAEESQFAGKALSETITACRACGSEELVPFLDLGRTPLADRLVPGERRGEPEIRVPLEVVFCPTCTLVQITETVDPEILFCRNYPYYSSVSPSLMDHFRQSAESLIATRELGPSDMVIEAASNDGYLLKHFLRHGCQVLGIDPADGPAATAEKAGVPTMNTFFDAALARKLRRQGVIANVFLANNVLAHVADLHGFVEGIHTLLADDGVAVVEAPYLLDLLDKCEFDTIYHQHLCYFSVTALDRLFRRHGLFLNEVERTPIHGGSLRLFIEKEYRPGSSVAALLENEQERGVGDDSLYRGFGERVEHLREHLRGLLSELKRSGNRIAGYGAAAKACTLTSYCGIDRSVLDYIVDRNPHKQQQYMSGIDVPIVGPDAIESDPTDYLVILAWNFADEIMKQQSEYARGGGRFIIPVPEVRVEP